MVKNQVIPELIYFKTPGRGNLTRLVFIIGNVDFKDTRIDYFKEWNNIKKNKKSIPSQLFSRTPCIKHGKLLLGQSTAVVHYASEIGIWKIHNFSSKKKSIDMMIVTTCEDIRTAMYPCFLGELIGKKESVKALKDLPSKINNDLESLERIFNMKKNKGPFLNNKTLSTSDLAIFDIFESPFPGLKKLNYDLSSFPQLLKVSKNVLKNHKIKSFVSNGW